MTSSSNLKLICSCFLILSLTGCYEEKVKDAASKLEVGMTKSAVDDLFKGLKFLKVQTVEMYPNATESMMRGSLWNNKNYQSIHPDNLIEQLSFDGNTKVYSYLIRRERVYANPNWVDYFAVFHNQKEDKVIGWAHLRVSGDVDSWPDSF